MLGSASLPLRRFARLPNSFDFMRVDLIDYRGVGFISAMHTFSRANFYGVFM